MWLFISSYFLLKTSQTPAGHSTRVVFADLFFAVCCYDWSDLIDRVQWYVKKSGAKVIADRCPGIFRRLNLSVCLSTLQRLDGSIKGEIRKQALDHFNAEGSEVGILMTYCY